MSVIEALSQTSDAFASHRRVYEYKSQPPVTHILVIDKATSAAILYFRVGAAWEQRLCDDAESEPWLGIQRHRELLASGCRIALGITQVEILISALDEIRALGDVGFQLEQCEDLDPGHALTWDNDGTPEQDRAVDDIMDRLAKALFYSE